MRQLARLLVLLLVALVSLQLFFIARIALMRWVDPQSTTFQRSEWWRLAHERGTRISWTQQWVDAEQIAESLKRAVIASEDAGFVDHSGVEWDAIERAWERNQRAQTVQERRVVKPGVRQRPVKLVGGSTITQQLAKNLFLSGERTLPRKAQEFILTWTLEALLGKRRILEIYLNSVEWGEGVFGAQAAARHYHQVDA
jgi:monofunctional biosynthetic peptidoglycan transglycosylase